jgi:CubicO group peptidase (beta-lactamase class C family)
MTRRVAIVQVRRQRRIYAALCVVAIGLAIAGAFALTIPLDRDPAARAGRAAATTPLPPGVRSLDPILEPIRAAHHVPALAAAIVQGDRLVAIGAVDVRKGGDSVRVTVGDRFHIGSCTKSMTATLIGALVDEGRLHWDTTIAEVLPDLAGRIRPEYRAVTVDQLLHHRSGLPDDRGNVLLLWRYEALRGPLTRQRLRLALIALQQRPAAPRGVRTIYSNAGYCVLGVIAERVTGQSWEDLMRRRIFAPLGMASAGFGSPNAGGSLDQPWGHLVFGRVLPRMRPDAENRLPAAIGPAGNVSLSLADWGKYAALHLDAERGRCRLLSCSTFRHLHEASPGSLYACGWGRGSYEGLGPVLQHAGSDGRWYATIGLAPERDLAILTAANEGDPAGSRACGAAVSALVRDWLPRH